MRWFRGHAEAPRLLRLSPLRADEDVNEVSYHFRTRSRCRDMSPVRWARRKSSSSESERNCYNVQTSQVTTERTSNKKGKKRIQEERRRVCEKRNPLLDRVKSTRLSFFKDHDSDEEENDGEGDEEARRVQFRSMYELRHRDLLRNELRRSVCESDLKDITEEEKNHAKRRRRAKSQSRLPYKKHQEERFSFLGFRTSTPRKQSEWSRETDSIREDAMPHDYRWGKMGQDFLDANPSADQAVDRMIVADTKEEILRDANGTIFKKGTTITAFDSITPSSCLAAKFRAMQDKYLKSSTNKLIAKIYKKDCKDKERRRLRSFSYGTLPGLEELRTNPLYEDQDQDDNDSGILDNDSATSSLLDDRCSSGASGPLNNSSHNDSCLGSPPRLPPRRPFSTAVDVDRTARLFASLDTYDRTKDISGTNFIEVYSNVCQAANDTLIDQAARISAENNTDREREERSADEDSKRKKRIPGLQVVRSKPYTTETMVVKLIKETSDQCLGIFIAKTSESSPGYLVAHVVPNGLADKEGTLKIGDEILIVNGKRLRGLSMAEARKILGNGSGPGDVDIVVSRYSSVDQLAKRLKESSVDYENVSMEDGYGVIVESSPSSHFRKHQTRCHRDRKDESNRSISSDKFATNMDSTFAQNISKFCTLPRRPRNTVSTFLTVLFEKGTGKKSLGFTIVGGRDSPKGSIGIFIKSVLPGGQAAEDGRLRAGDEILAVNGQVCHDLTHREAVQLFRNIKSGPIALHLCRRVKNRESQTPKAKSCADLLLIDT
ncbi:partitioning defective 3 homolog [Cataglyphis hispanica]|uniref:partitioning defective 3 homolog n=1 Tax=Cataglyphis hispanica TaxID=1086592 RepID=UPI00218086FA|nr:partitioning defective 3 homolog [Cataglyphis hispanica]XP_050462020.1 partitioning defective 3 homolog [Cataglyphis hispanica]